jgi:hypothetical protein
MKKKRVGYLLKCSAVAQLEEVAMELRRDKTDIVEQLIEEFLPKMLDAEAKRIAEVQAKYGEVKVTKERA